jgi:chemotaxis protein methyltransferase CheR
MQQDNALTDTEFVAMRDLVYRKTGIFFAERNRFLLDARIREILHETGSRDAHTYLKMLNDPKTSLPEFNRLINKITITETSFFRDPHQIAALSKNIIPELVKRHEQHGIRLQNLECRPRRAKRLTRWPFFSASTSRMRFCLWNISIYATDINEDAVNACKMGLYKAYALRIPPRKSRTSISDRLRQTGLPSVKISRRLSWLKRQTSWTPLPAKGTRGRFDPVA